MYFITEYLDRIEIYDTLESGFIGQIMCIKLSIEIDKTESGRNKEKYYLRFSGVTDAIVTLLTPLHILFVSK